MKASWGFFALLASGVMGLVPAAGQTLAPANAGKPLVTMSPSGAAAAALTASDTPAPAMAPPSAVAPVATGTSPQNLVAYSSCNVDGSYIALTFDDGPNPETTPKLLKMLEARGIKATFFVLGSRAVADPAIIKQMQAQGHEIANHSWNHPQLPKIPVAAADKQIADTSAAIEQITGKAPIYVRPPYGAMTPALRAHLREKFGVTFIYWSVDPLDWKDRNPQTIHDRVLAQVHPGAIVLAHDIHATTVEAMPKLLDDLAARGYKFVTVSQLIAMNKSMPEPKVAVAAPAAPKKKPKPAAAANASAAKPASAKPGTTPSATKPAAAKPAAAKPGTTPAATPASATRPATTRSTSGAVGLF